MFRKLLLHADRSFVAVHALAWSCVMVAWIFSWRVEPAPVGPLFNFAKRFIGHIDLLVYFLTDKLALAVAVRSKGWVGADSRLVFTVAFACMILVSGTLQWYLLGRIIRWALMSHGQILAAILATVLLGWVGIQMVLWIY